MPTLSRMQSTWLRALVTWLAYTVSGLAALVLAPPSDDVSPLYLAAGVGLAAVLGWGRSMSLAVGLGSATVEWAGEALLRGSAPPLPALLAVCVMCGIGSGLQSWVAARLVQADSGAPLPLDRPAQIARFLLLAGPVACVIGAGISVSSMAMLGIIPFDELPNTVKNWWAGDTLGVLIATPLVLTLVGKPADLWRSRRLVLGIPLVVTTLLLGVAMRQVQLWESEREAAVFDQGASATANEVRSKLYGYIDALEAMHGVFAASSVVHRDEFQRASTHWIQPQSGVQALGWAESVRAADLPRFQAKQRKEGLPDFQVFNGKARSAPQGRDDLAVLRFVEPMQGNEAALGFNLLSGPESRAAYEQARLEGKAVATNGLDLIQEVGHQHGVVIYRPVYQEQAPSPSRREASSRGAVFLALRMDDALSAMLQGAPDYLAACLLEGNEVGASFLAGSPDCRKPSTAESPEHRSVIPIEFAGKTWQLVVWATKPVPFAGSNATSWVLAFGGVALAASMGAMLLVMTGHAQRIQAAMDEAERQRVAAEAANLAKSEFLSRMSHELRTPLNAVLGFAQVMELDRVSPLAPSQKPRIQQIQQAGWHLLDMIDDVLDISRIDTGALRLQAEPLSVAEALAAVGVLLEDSAVRHGITLVWPDHVPSQWGVNADPTRLRQILTNLLSNAIKYNQQGGSVGVSVHHQQRVGKGEWVTIAVSDTGLGMSPDQLDQLFEPFNRLGRERVIPDGTGIGLVISRHLAALMGGELTVQSQVGMGSTFTLSLPALTLSKPAEASGPVSPPPHPAAPSDNRVRHMLYVEDNLANAELIRAALNERPWVQLTVATTIEEGLAVLHDRLRGAKPELILLDVHLPDASGQELLRLIKANPDTAPIPVIMVSADATPGQIDQALSAGAFCYLTKPIQIGALLRQVDALLKS
jgi:signal transduction histidine kinase/ActR/RegA family two-component response regulator